MRVMINEDRELVEQIREGLRRKGGICPCHVGMDEDFRCMCKEFREQIADPDFEGYCHCQLYRKERD